MRKFAALFLSLMMVFTLTGCTVEKTQIAYTVYPVGFLAQRLAGDVVSTESIQNDGIIQRATVKENYLEILDNSAVFLHIGQLEPYLALYSQDIYASVSSHIDLSSLNAVYDFKRYTQVITDGEVTYVETPYYRGDEFAMIDTDTKDLYLWTDPIAMLSMAKDIEQWLETTYPDDASTFRNNLSDIETDLINLDAQYQALATSNELNNKVIRFVSMTSTFGNWQKTYGFQLYPLMLSKYGALPNEEQLALIENRIQEDGIKYIVYESNMTEDMIALFNRVQEDLNLTRVELSNLSSLTQDEKDAGKDYLSLMYENLAVLQTMVEDRPTVTTSTSTSEDETTIIEVIEEEDENE